MRIKFEEGDVFVLPLRNGGYARGVVARKSARDKSVMAYFFGPRLSSHENARLNDLRPSEAICKCMCGDLGLVKGAWRILGKVALWDRSQWPIPAFVRHDPLGAGRPIRVRYDDTDLGRVVERVHVDSDAGLLPDALSGYGAAEIEVTEAISASEAMDNRRNNGDGAQV